MTTKHEYIYKNEINNILNVIIEFIIDNSVDEFDINSFEKLLNCLNNFVIDGILKDRIYHNKIYLGEAGIKENENGFYITFRKPVQTYKSSSTPVFETEYDNNFFKYTSFNKILKKAIAYDKQQYIKLEKIAFEILG